MRFSCDDCGRSYVASDDLAGRAFRMRCKECGREIVVRPPQVAPPAAAPTPAAARAATPAAPARRAFDPFEGEDLPPPDVSVGSESLEILDRTPPAIRLPPRPPPAPSGQRSTRATPPPRAPLPPRVRVGRVLPAEDEEKLGPPGEEGGRSISRWIIALVVAGVAAAGGLLLRR